MKDLTLSGKPEKNDAFSNIVRYMTTADIVLTAKEDEILNRWIYADTLMRGRKHSEAAIVEQMKARFGVSVHTARNDLFKAQALFEKSRKYSKRYLMFNHVEELQLHIERIKHDKSLQHILPKLYGELTKAIKELPEDPAIDLPDTTPIRLTTAGPTETAMPFDQARQKAAELLTKRKEQEYTDYEEVES
ncbi:MAG: hypothetical protein EOP50_00170 [Sphingobacteriales bacterium]|nr:MAG: hypothetical protein EOP50_00170 [Sphingobacteriales bacterium]